MDLAEDGVDISMAVQVADGKRSLASVYRMYQTGHKVVLDGESSYMVHKKSGRVTPIELKDGQFLFHVWVNKLGCVGNSSSDVFKGSKFAALATQEEDEEVGGVEAVGGTLPGFAWQDKLF